MTERMKATLSASSGSAPQRGPVGLTSGGDCLVEGAADQSRFRSLGIAKQPGFVNLFSRQAQVRNSRSKVLVGNLAQAVTPVPLDIATLLSGVVFIGNGLIILAGSTVGSYVFGAAWDDMNADKSKREGPSR